MNGDSLLFDMLTISTTDRECHILKLTIVNGVLGLDPSRRQIRPKIVRIVILWKAVLPEKKMLEPSSKHLLPPSKLHLTPYLPPFPNFQFHPPAFQASTPLAGLDLKLSARNTTAGRADFTQLTTTTYDLAPCVF